VAAFADGIPTNTNMVYITLVFLMYNIVETPS